MITETITSAQNPKIRMLTSLQEKSRTRRKEGLFVVEGRREILRCLDAGFKVKTLFVCPEIIGRDDLVLIEKRIVENKLDADCLKIEVPEILYSKIAYREGTEGVIAEALWREIRLEDLKIGESPLVIVLESVEKPGNLGAVLRSADAAGADAVLVCDPMTDLFNPNLIRSSTGTIFSRQVVATTSEEAIKWLKDNGIHIFTAQLQDSSLYYDTDMTGGTAIVMGTEATGLTDIWRNAADAHIRIPMLGQADSLNVSVSAAILLFEALRQRRCRQ